MSLASRMLLPLVSHMWGNQRREKSGGLHFRCGLVALGSLVQSWCSSHVDYVCTFKMWCIENLQHLRPGVPWGQGAVSGGQHQACWGQLGSAPARAGWARLRGRGWPGMGLPGWWGPWSGRAGDVSCGLPGAGADGPGAGMGPGAMGTRGGRQGHQAHACTQALRLQTNILIPASADRNVT